MSTDSRARLVDCFASVFPDLERDALQNATMDSVENWDSLITVTIVAVVQEEFGIQIPTDQYPKLASFAGILELVERLKK